MRLALVLLVVFARLGMSQHVPQVSLAAGAGQSFGMVGVRAELFVVADRVSILGAAGYEPDISSGSSLTGAATVRYYVHGSRHRIHLDASWTPLYVLGTDVFPPEEWVVYGPGLALGYTFVAQSGLTATLGGGVAYDTREEGHAWPLVQLGVGWTFRHAP